LAFVPFLFLTLILWVVYRNIFHFEVWFDESIGKAIFFGFPVWLYISFSRDKSIVDSMMPDKLAKGLLLGLALGGIYGFVGSLIGMFQHTNLQNVLLFTSMNFWWEFMLAMLTGFWESLFFFGWIMTVVMKKLKGVPLVSQVVLVSLIFVVFHVPNIFIRFTGVTAIVGQTWLLFLFALGQSLIFVRWKNLYTLMLSQAIWGMVLLIHVR